MVIIKEPPPLTVNKAILKKTQVVISDNVPYGRVKAAGKQTQLSLVASGWTNRP